MVCQQHICFNHAVYIEDWTAAGKALKNIKMLHPTEGFLKEIVLHLSKEDYGAAFEQAKSCLATILVGAENCEHYLRLLLLMAEVYMGSGQLHIALSYAKKSLADSRAHHLSSIETQSRLLLAQIWVQLGQPDKSLKLLTDVMIDVLSQGSQLMRGLAHLTLAQITMSFIPADKEHEKISGCNKAVEILDAALSAFSQIKAVQYIRKVLLYQMQVFHLLGYENDRNNCADQVKQWMATKQNT